ncbi:hypothetical protein P7B02_01995 [Caulobacter segnis]|uniref:hypothetical protein n=1 Tax=Caulobacter segnis TaxID=88688 RepID=UPI00240F7B66|nr:hypothetical protein [Caulobacter segnis]MDG2520297.1 hypothetical protein [Caulobacter segnis]
MFGERFSLFVVHAQGWRWSLVGQDGVTAAGGEAGDLDTALEEARASAAAFSRSSSMTVSSGPNAS